MDEREYMKGIIDAVIDGEPVEYRARGGKNDWIDRLESKALPNFQTFDYRRKSVPFEGWVAINIKTNWTSRVCKTQEEVDTFLTSVNHKYRIVKLVEET